MKNKKLMNSFKKSFKRYDDMDTEAEEMEEGVKPSTLYQGKNDREVSLNRSFNKRVKPRSDVYSSDGHSTDENRLYGENADSNDEGYDSISPDDDSEYEAEMEEQIEHDSQPMFPDKKQRKRFAVAALSKKMSKPKKSNY